ncbi:MAG: DNA mismatch endonuclease Vsr [Ilumatobacteraceae bacterium]
MLSRCRSATWPACLCSAGTRSGNRPSPTDIAGHGRADRRGDAPPVPRTASTRHEPRKVAALGATSKGLRFRVDRKVLPGLRSRPDIVLGPSKVAVFVDGCFWHRCAEHGTIPKNNREWWTDKLDANVERDRRADRQLTDAGWHVLGFWEHDATATAADVVERTVRSRRALRGAGSKSHHRGVVGTATP